MTSSGRIVVPFSARIRRHRAASPPCPSRRRFHECRASGRRGGAKRGIEEDGTIDDFELQQIARMAFAAVRRSQLAVVFTADAGRSAAVQAQSVRHARRPRRQLCISAAHTMSVVDATAQPQLARAAVRATVGNAAHGHAAGVAGGCTIRRSLGQWPSFGALAAGGAGAPAISEPIRPAWAALWCARFMNMVLERSRPARHRSNMAARSPVTARRVSGPQVGAIAVMSRGKRGGHVGIVSGIDDSAIRSSFPAITAGGSAESVYPRGPHLRLRDAVTPHPCLPADADVACRVAAAERFRRPAFASPASGGSACRRRDR